MKIPESFKQNAVQKFLSRGRGHHETIRVAQEIGVNPRTLYNWTRECGKSSDMPKNKKRPQDRTAKEKFKAVMEYESLPEE